MHWLLGGNKVQWNPRSSFDPGSRFIGSGVSSNTPYLIHAKNAQKELEQSCVTVDDIRFDVILMFMPRIL